MNESLILQFTIPNMVPTGYLTMRVKFHHMKTLSGIGNFDSGKRLIITNSYLKWSF